MVSQQIALFSTSSRVPFTDVSVMAQAIQVQLTRDYEPIWQRPTTIRAFENEESIPRGWWKAQIMDDIGQPGALGFHSDENNQPQAFIDVNDTTSVTASHEVLEMATDPGGNRLIPCTLRGEAVLMLCEVCDPNEAESYTINGIAVSNFYRPEYFDPSATEGFKYDFLGNNTTPMFMNPGGYCSYMKNGAWYQDTYFDGSAPTTRGPLALHRRPDQSLRSMIDEYMRANNWQNTI